MSDETRGTSDDNELSRRAFLRGTAVVGIALGAEGYVRPALRTLGVTQLNAAASTPVRLPPPGGGTDQDDDDKHDNDNKHDDDDKDKNDDDKDKDDKDKDEKHGKHGES